MVNRRLPWGRRDAAVLKESRVRTQGANMSARMTILAAALVLSSAGGAHAACAAAIAEFETIINSDAATGNLNKGVHRRIVAELADVKASCGAGHDAEATRALAGVKSRHGYR